MKIKKEHFLLILMAVVLLMVVIGIVFFALRPKPTPSEPTEVISPTPITSALPSPFVNAGVPPVSYNSGATDRLIEKVKNRTALSESDASAKQKILSLLPQGRQSGYVHQSPTVRIEYLSSPDAFLAEILTIDISRSKTDTVAWFRSQGMSQEGICNLPVSFYLNFDVAQDLRDSNITLNPLPEGC